MNTESNITADYGYIAAIDDYGETDAIGFVVLLIIIAVIAALNVALRRKHRDGAWHPLVRTGGDPVMHRYVDGRWEQRPMNDGELADHQDTFAW